jgi:hypothetical protein
MYDDTEEGDVKEEVTEAACDSGECNKTEDIGLFEEDLKKKKAE